MRPTVEQLREVRDIVTALYGTIPGFQGAGVGDSCVRVYVTSRHVREMIPALVRDIAVEVVVVPDISAQS